MDSFDFVALTGIILSALLLAGVLERLVQILVKPVVAGIAKVISGDIAATGSGMIPIIAGGLGVGIAFAFNIDLIGPTLESFGHASPTTDAGLLLTGFIIGGGSHLVHDIWPSGGGDADIANIVLGGFGKDD